MAARAGPAQFPAPPAYYNQLQAGLSKLTPPQKENQPPQDEEDDVTVKPAVQVSQIVRGRGLSPEEQKPAGSLVHYLFGTAAGGVYGLLAEKTPAARAGLGTLFDSALWLVSDEIAVPALGLAKGPRSYSLGTHASALASHLVYGAATELVRSGLRTT